MKFSAILAIDENNLIGNGDKLPWHLPNDLKHFKQLTTNKIVVMGRKTFESIGRPLANRINVILTRSKTFKTPEGTIVLRSLRELKTAFQGRSDVFIIGGAELIEQLYDDIETFYITHIDKSFEGDTYIDINFDELDMISEEYVDDDKDVDFGYSFCKYCK